MGRIWIVSNGSPGDVSALVPFCISTMAVPSVRVSLSVQETTPFWVIQPLRANSLDMGIGGSDPIGVGVGVGVRVN